LYVERLKPLAIAVALKRAPSSITREREKGVDSGIYNPILAEARCLEAGRNQWLRLKMTGETRDIINPRRENR
jgi:IS30 family transposase